jgi:uncharacterized protein YkwD
MNYIDIILIAIILLSVWAAWRKGFIHASVDLIVWAAGLAGGFLLYPHLARLFEKFLSPSAWLMPLSFLLGILLCGAVFNFLARLLLERISPGIYRSRLNHAAGIIPGLVSGAITALVVALLLLSLPLKDGLSENVRDSKMVAQLVPCAEWLQDKLSPVFDEAAKQTMTRLTVEPDSEKTIKLPFTYNSAQPRADLEIRMLQLVNEERAKAGIKPVAADTALRNLARDYSKDMFTRGYFSHYTPERTDPFQRMKKANIRFLAAGENLALAQTLPIAHNGLMNSPGHRANILNPKFGRLGIGVLDGGRRGLMITQEFRN